MACFDPVDHGHPLSGGLLAWDYRDPFADCCLTKAVLVFQVSCQRVLRIGIDANTWGEAATENLYNYTFDVYLNEQLKGTSFTFQTVLFNSIDDFAAAGLNHSVDIFLTGPGMFVCLQVS